MSLSLLETRVNNFPDTVLLVCKDNVTCQLKFRKFNEGYGILTGICRISKPSFEGTNFIFLICDIPINCRHIGLCVNNNTKKSEVFKVDRNVISIAITEYLLGVIYYFNCILQ